MLFLAVKSSSHVLVLKSQFHENDMFSIKMDPCLLFYSSKDLDLSKSKYSLKLIFISSSVNE